MKFWARISRYLLWLTLFILPWQMRKVIVPVFHQGAFVEYAAISLYATDLLIMALLIIWLPGVLAKKRFCWGPRAISWPLVALVVWMWLSLIWVHQLGLSLLVGSWTAGHFTLFVLFYLYLINNVRTIRDILWPLGWGVACQGLIALGQYFSNHSLGLKWLDESVLDPNQSGIPVVIVDGVRRLRGHGLLPHANLLGGFLATSLALLVPWLYAVKRQWPHYLMWLLFTIGVLGLVVSLSRSAWAVFLLSMGGLALWALWARPKKLRAAILPGLIVTAVTLALVISQYSVIVPRFDLSEPVEQISLSDRLRQWGEFKEVYRKHPVVGVGIGQYVPYLKYLDQSTLGWSYREDVDGWVYNPGRDGRYYEPVHNIYLLAIAELGIVGGALLALILIGALVVVGGLVRKRRALVGVAALLSWLSLLVLGLIDHYPWTLQQGRLLVFLVLGMMAVLSVHSGYNKKRGGRKKRQFALS